MFVNTLSFGADGIAISPDGVTLYFSTTGGDQLFSVPTKALLDRGQNSELMAQASVMSLGHKGAYERYIEHFSELTSSRTYGRYGERFQRQCVLR